MIRHIAHQLAAGQHGAIATWQLRHHAGRIAITHELQRTGNWKRQSRQVFVSAASNRTDRTDLMVAVLGGGPGTFAARHSAAALWKLPGFAIVPAHIVRTKATNSTRPIGTTCHDTRRLPSEDVTVLDSFPVTTPSRTVIDLARGAYGDWIERVLDAAWSRGLIDGASMTACCDRLGGRGRPEVTTIRGLLGARGVDWIAPASNLESRVNQVLRAAGIGPATRQTNIGGRTWLGRVDFLIGSRVVLEVQSELHHTALSDQRDDEARFEAMENAGFDCIAAWDNEIWRDSGAVVERVRQALRASRAA